ncbi:FMN-dependent NADH-azoreductase [Lysobacter sp. A6]|uniref:FMN dependent NADH:quinone oxidoreductase n=1 Tax=Noviluteimonas lactosilytica TaxID=2888523 RepID=A0ABS8JGH6_9GAMM|nr:FMN-dependent NADH-azoreductase [Lysobacter lactosilyticus]MCC8362664.1 FMN-dependent NADH-azoreductase [Lysobacter lactosilyticus]
MKILHLDSSIQAEQSVTRRLSAAIVERLRKVSPQAVVTYRDLAADPLPELSPEQLRTPSTARESALDELLDADTIVIGAPMYNFTIPSQLKAWLDAVVIAGRTFRYSEAGVEGLLGDKRVIIASSRGGVYSPGGAMAAFDHQEAYLRNILGFVGVRDVEVIRAEGVRMGEDAAHRAITDAMASVGQLRSVA